MKLDIDISALVNLRKKMGAKLEKEKKELFKEKTITPPKIKKNVQVLSKEELNKKLNYISGLASVDNHLVTLHIYQPREIESDLLKNPAPDPKYHFAECETIKRQIQSGSFDRYVVSERTDGLFPVQPINEKNYQSLNKEILAKLLPCENCLTLVDFKDFTKMKNILDRKEKQNFKSKINVEEIFNYHHHIFRSLPAYTSKNYPSGQYSKTFSKISNQIREMNNWVCSCCGGNFNKYKKQLHTHHKNRIKGMNNIENLECLCIACHGKKPYHSHIVCSPDEKEIIKNARREANVNLVCLECKS